MAKTDFWVKKSQFLAIFPLFIDILLKCRPVTLISSYDFNLILICSLRYIYSIPWAAQIRSDNFDFLGHPNVDLSEIR